MGIEEDTARFWLDVSRLDYSEENERRNDYKSRDAWEFRLFDAWGHCYIAAATVREVGENATWVLGTGYEVLHEGFSWVTLNLLPHDSFAQDTYNQAVGRSIGESHPTGDLHWLCFEAMLNGRLDLTLAGISRGGRLRR